MWRIFEPKLDKIEERTRVECGKSSRLEAKRGQIRHIENDTENTLRG